MINLFGVDVNSGFTDMTRLKTVKGYGLVDVKSRDEFKGPDYDMDTIYKAWLTDSYFMLAVNKHLTLCTKEGWAITGKDKTAVDYIRRRLRELARVTKAPTSLLIRDMLRDIILYSNAVLLKVRAPESSSGKPIETDDKLVEPVAGYFPQPVRMFSARRDPDKGGRVIEWKQDRKKRSKTEAALNIDIDEIANQFRPGYKGKRNKDVKTYSPSDVVHLWYNREPGQLFGKSLWIPVLDDILMLRRIEQNVELLLYESLHPVKHLKVGEEGASARPGEIDEWERTVNEMEPDEWLVSDGRVNVKVEGAQGRALNAQPYLEHAKTRVHSGLAMSAVDYGEGGTANRGTATTITQMRIDLCKDFQNQVAMLFKMEIIGELLLEGGFDPIDEDSDMVELRFKEIDVDDQIKRENHAADLYTKNAVTETEMRQRLEMDPITDEERYDTYFERIQLPLAELKATPDDVGGAPETNRDQPANQYGKKKAATPPVNQ